MKDTFNHQNQKVRMLIAISLKECIEFLKLKNLQIRLLGSGAILNESIKAAEILSGFAIESEVWSVTSFNMLRKDGMEVENENIKNPLNQAKESFVAKSFSEHDIPTVASTDYMRAYSEQIRPIFRFFLLHYLEPMVLAEAIAGQNCENFLRSMRGALL